MYERSTNRAKGLIGAAAVLAAIAVGIPPISSADRGHRDDHRDRAVGTVESFDRDTGILVIAPTDGDEVAAIVTGRTKIDCEREHEDEQGDDDGDGDGGPGPGKHGGGRRGNCSPDDLTTGATVEEAELEITADGLVYEEVELR